jgi:hypothetical protein
MDPRRGAPTSAPRRSPATPRFWEQRLDSRGPSRMLGLLRESLVAPRRTACLDGSEDEATGPFTAAICVLTVLVLVRRAGLSSSATSVLASSRGGARCGRGIAVRQSLKPPCDGCSSVALRDVSVCWQYASACYATYQVLAAPHRPTTSRSPSCLRSPAGRQAHLAANADALAHAGEMLTQPPSIEHLDVIAAKLPNR